jgi:two-component system LytT family response regulator
MNKIKAIIIDDSDEARQLLRMMISFQSDEIEITGEASNAEKGIELIKNLKPDVVFLDIEMPDKSGLQLVKELPGDSYQYEVIFTTAYNNYALNAFRLSAIDYLLKPINEDHLRESIIKLKKMLRSEESSSRRSALILNLTPDTEKKLCLPVFNGHEYINLEELEYIEASGSYSIIHLTTGKSKTISKNLKYFSEVLDGNPNFVRVHRSFLINLKHMTKFSKNGRGVILMSSGIEIDLARERREIFFEAIKIN